MTKRRPPLLDRPTRDREADRALFEDAVARFESARAEKPGDGSGKDGDAEAVGIGAGGARPRFAKRAARGKVEPDATIDLHGLDRDRATERLRIFLSAVSREVVVVLVVHGRGQGILAAAAAVELDRHPRVAEHLPAPARLGGAGARLVRLRG